MGVGLRFTTSWLLNTLAKGKCALSMWDTVIATALLWTKPMSQVEYITTALHP